MKMQENMNKIEIICELISMAIDMQRGHDECMNLHMRDIMERIQDLQEEFQNATSERKESE